MDPLLARYIALKRDIEGRKAGGTTTPIRYAEGAERSSSSHHHHNHHQHTPMGHNLTSVSAIHSDARSILQSPRLATAPPAPTPSRTAVADGGLSPALRKRLAARLESDGLSAHARRGADIELGDLQSRLQQQQLELDDMLGKLQASERQLRNTKDALEKSEAARSDLEIEAATRVRESESAANNSRQMGGANLRLMEGRLAAMKEQLDRKDEEIQQWILRSKESEREVGNQEARMQELRDALNNKERSAGEHALTAESHKQQVRRLKEQLEEAVVESKIRGARVSELEGALRTKELEMERMELQQRDGITGQKRHLASLEAEVASLRDQLRETESIKGHVEGRNAELTQSLAAQEKELRDTVVKLEALRVRSAQDSIVVDESRFDLESAKETAARLKSDLHIAAERNEDLEAELESLQGERRARQMLEAQLQGMNTAAERQREDLEHQRLRIEDCDRRNAQLQREVEVIPELRERVAELNDLVEGKNAVIDKQRQVERSLQAEVGELKTKVTGLEDHKEQAEKDALRTRHELDSKNAHIDSLLEESRKIPALQGEVDALRQTVLSRNKDIEALQGDITGWKGKCMEMDSDIETLLDVKKQFDELVATHRSLYADLEERSGHLEQVRSQLNDTTQALHNKDIELRELNAMLMEVETQAGRQQSQLADKAALESRLRQLSAELVSVRAELDQEREKREEVKARLQQRDEMYVLERQTKQEAEDRLAKLHDEYSIAQVEVGKSQVRLESLDRESKRLGLECEQRRKEAEDAQDKLATARRDLSSAQSELRETVFKNTHLSSDVARYADEVAKLQDTVKEVRAKLHVCEERVAFLLPLEDRCRTAEAQVGSMTQRLEDKEADLEDTGKALKNARSALAKLEGEVESLEKANGRLRESKALADKQMMVLDSLERDDEAKAKQLLEKERELSRLRERATLLGADLEAERSRKRSLEGRIKDLEKECERASTLDGQVAGLNQVIQQRNRSLEEERASNNELRARLARGGLDANSNRSIARSRSSVPADAEAKIAVKDEIIRQMEADDRRRQEQLDEARHKLVRSEERLQKAEEALRGAKEELMLNEAAWTQRYAKLEAAYDAACSACDSRPESDALRAELADAKRRIQHLQDEVREKDREVRVLRNHMASTPDTADYTRQMEAKVNHMSQQLEEKELELAVAVDNLTNIQRRTQLSSLDRDRSPMQPSVEDEVSRWREQRRIQQQLRNASPEVSRLRSPHHH